MAPEQHQVEHRLRILEGQIEALREHLDDPEKSCGQVAHLVRAIDGGWARIRAGVLRRYLRECLEVAELKPDDERLSGQLEAIERLAR